jgi:hypothetical protein
MMKAKAATTARKAKAKRSTKAKTKRPDGSISSGIYDAVEKLTSGGKMKRSEAFRQIAKESGRKEGTVAVNYYYVAKKRGGTKRTGTGKAAGKVVKAATTAPKKAGVSATIYDAIEKLMAGGKMKRAVAFRQLAKQTGRKEGTVAVNYYYAAKKRQAKPAKRGRAAAAAGTRRHATPSNIESMLKSLAELIRAQAAEIDALRREGERFAAIRRLVAS